MLAAIDSLIKSKRSMFSLSLLIFLISIILVVYEFRYLLQIETQAFDARKTRVQMYIDSYRNVVSDFQQNFKTTYEKERMLPLANNSFNKLREYPQFNVYGISGMAADQGDESLSGTLTGSGDIKNLDENLRRELSAALGLDRQFSLHLDGESELVWAYYVSNKNFIYIAPKKTVSDFHFEKNLYDQFFWKLALPSVNPKMVPIVTPLYEDTAGQGLMTTISAPIVIEGKFFGVTCVDIGVKTLRVLLASNFTQGVSMLISSDRSIIGKPSDMQIGEIFSVNLDMQAKGLQWIGTDLWLVKPVIENQLYMVNAIPLVPLIKAAFLATAHLWLIFFTVLGIAIFF